MPVCAPITLFNRQTGRIESEAVYGEGFLRFVYENPLGELALHAVAKRHFFSKWYGWRMDRPGSTRLIRPFIERYGVDVSEFADPVGSFRSFNEFFVRRLKSGVRPVDARPEAAVFPADGRHRVIPDASVVDSFFVKGTRFDLESLLGDAQLAARFATASILISRLCPVDYHRFHFPLAGIPGAPRRIKGPLYSVSPIALRKRPSILWENERFVTVLGSSALGDVLVVEIGATNVGTVVHTSTPHRPVGKGDEKGCFRFGGSCLVTVFEPGRVRFAGDLLEHSAAGREVYARVGEWAAEAV